MSHHIPLPLANPAYALNSEKGECAKSIEEAKAQMAKMEKRIPAIDRELSKMHKRLVLRGDMVILKRPRFEKPLTLCDSTMSRDTQNTQDHAQTRTYTRAMTRDR